ncbi:MAG: class I SAM-dependent methyltransferase [Acidobacteriota bacterium]|nr:class I SAM-dependent methyltransferase [Acidobacteriota bacterium]MDH3529612.1 class I SAM-dependent methyltransferase [Acidobacteriota bacterium]
MQSAHEKMDRMYRYQRYIYDATRKYYLLGRDHLIREMDVGRGERILEVGCGTGRNLAILAAKHPDSFFYGLDASAEMLATANRKISAKNLRNVLFETALADDFAFDSTFGLKAEFDAIYFSYSISMIPAWREAITNALRNLKQGRSIYIVDFYDQRDLPQAFARLLKSWLKKFHVKYPEELIPYLQTLEREGLGFHSVRPVYKSYSFLAEIRKG